MTPQGSCMISCIISGVRPRRRVVTTTIGKTKASRWDIVEIRRREIAARTKTRLGRLVECMQNAVQHAFMAAAVVIGHAGGGRVVRSTFSARGHRGDAARGAIHVGRENFGDVGGFELSSEGGNRTCACSVALGFRSIVRRVGARIGLPGGLQGRVCCLLQVHRQPRRL